MAQTSLEVADRISQLGEYFFARANKKIADVAKQGTRVINLGIGSPDLPPAPEVIVTLETHAKETTAHVYPSYAGLGELRSEIARWYQREYAIELDPSNMVLPLAGSKEGIVFTTLALVNPGEEVLIPNPGYSTYERATNLAGGITRMYPLVEANAYQPDFEALEQTDLSKVKLMWINYPHNPTSATASLKQLTAISEFAARHSIIIASDNPYSHITFEKEREASILEVPGAIDYSVELNSCSKTYNMAGWRLGWAVGNPTLIKAISTMYSNVETGIFLPVQHAGVTALQLPPAWIHDRNKIYTERLSIVRAIAQALGCQCTPTKASLYVWAKLPPMRKTAEEYCFELLEKTGVFITPGTAFGSLGEGYVRFSLCQPEQILKDALSKIQESLS